MREPRILQGGALEDVEVMSALEACAGTPWKGTDPREALSTGQALVILRPGEPRASTALVEGTEVSTGFEPPYDRIGDGDWPGWLWRELW